VEIRDIDSLERREDLGEDIDSGLMIRDANESEVKSLRGTQTAIAVVPAVYLSGKEGYVK
jgi:hypothetical protein